MNIIIGENMSEKDQIIDILDFLRFHHIAIAVKSFEKSINYYKSLAYNCTQVIYDPIQNVELVFCYSNLMPNVELVKPFDENSPIVNLLQNKDTIIYHQCYQTNNLSKAIEYLQRENKVFCISKPKPAILFNNKNVSFYQVPNVGLIEMLEVKEYE